LDGSWLAREKTVRIAASVGAIMLELGRPPENELAAVKARKLPPIPVFSEKH